MNTNDPNKRTLEGILDASAESLDASTLSKLRQARNRALEQETRPDLFTRLTGGKMAIAGGAVTATVTAAVFAFWIGVINPQTRVNAIEDIELLASADNTELYEQIDFYQWLESQQTVQGKNAG